MATSTQVVDQALIYILAFSALLFILIVFFMIYFLVRYREKRNPVAVEFKKGTFFLELAWIIAALALVLSMFVYGLTGFSFLRSIPKDSIVVKVNARQWSWLFEYGNGKKSPDMVVPIGKNIRCDLFSADVIHGFYVPAFHIQMDAVPGVPTQVWFKPESIGAYDIFCAQYCGLRHSEMLAKIYVVEGDLFDEWLEGKEITLPGKEKGQELAEGEKLLLERGCLSCHSVTGTKLTGPTFKGLFGSTVQVITDRKPRTIVADETYIRDSIITPSKDISDGYPDIMPKARDIITYEEIEKIIDYIEELK
jgi:cytochrome c oxidase subunit 2